MAVSKAWVVASHWSVCFMNRVMVAAKARISSSIRFSLMKHSWTPPFTASTNRSETLPAFLIASFFAFSAKKKTIELIGKNKEQNDESFFFFFVCSWGKTHLWVRGVWERSSGDRGLIGAETIPVLLGRMCRRKMARAYAPPEVVSPKTFPMDLGLLPSLRCWPYSKHI